MVKKYALGTGLCILALVLVTVFAAKGAPKWTYWVSVGVLLIGAGIQGWCLWKTRPSTW